MCVVFPFVCVSVGFVKKGAPKKGQPDGSTVVIHRTLPALRPSVASQDVTERASVTWFVLASSRRAPFGLYVLESCAVLHDC